MGRRGSAHDRGRTPGISRRDFVGVVAVVALAGSGLLHADKALAAASSGGRADGTVAGTAAIPSLNYPPAATGLRGQYPGSFEVAHAARDGGYMGEPGAQDTGEHYDLVVVGGGISA